MSIPKSTQSPLERREFLRRAGLLAGAAVIGGTGAARPFRSGRAPVAARTSVLDASAADAPFDTIVVVMMENRSFDHMLGWTGTDAAYLDAGRQRYGADFHIDGNQAQTFIDVHGKKVATHWLPGTTGEQYPYQGCGDNIPGHGWEAARVQRDKGFLAKGTGNSPFALGYYRASDMLFTEQMVRRFTTCDQWFSSLLGPTFPNREFFYTAQSGGRKGNPGPLKPGMYPTQTIWDKLLAANVPSAYYYTDLPILPLWGKRFYDITQSLDHYFDDASKGKLANVVMVDPGFQFANRTDDHPVGDVRNAQRWLRSVFQAFAQSPHWERGAFVMLYDEWGGFFDHVKPPLAPGAKPGKNSGEGFDQMGFRVPAIVASPFASPGFAEHTRYDHTSVLRLLEWRFLGAPTKGPAAGPHGRWWLTERDRNANNLAGALAVEPTVDLGFDVALDLPAGADPCTFGAKGGTETNGDPFVSSEAMANLQDKRFKEASETPWRAPDIPNGSG
jgi:phospholipase C